MTDISIEGGRLIAAIRGLDCLWTCRRHVVVPLAHVKSAHVDPHLETEGPWLAAGRTDALLGYAVAAGPMMVHGRHEFWDVHHPERAVSIDLEDEPFSRLVLEVEEPAAVIEAVNAAVRDLRTSSATA